ncbi:hypothetical protein GCM10017557_61800 [Streptomyces aurantiacus]|uniref:Secreted protein n=1 Tax=Streptomyces aurantiacus TaxID=47760 RepID=A0A7G1P9U5_9ACTN|nr:DUF6479 family protein [Streptomyces aurantiacus]BCL31321.1 hypothetical protein GCM10017557_61800 [Streptomyces aurantiacus]
MAVSDAAVGSIGAFVGGLVIVGVLVWAVRLGIKSRRGQPRPPRPEEQPRRPESGPVQEAREMREPDEVPRAADESERLSPHDLHASGSKRGENQDRPRWDSGSSGSFGGGGPGRT